jgi:hypothetical protein
MAPAVATYESCSPSRRCSIKWSRNISKSSRLARCRSRRQRPTRLCATRILELCAVQYPCPRLSPLGMSHCPRDIASIQSQAVGGRRMRVGVWFRPQLTWSNTSSPGSRCGNGWYQCPFPYNLQSLLPSAALCSSLPPIRPRLLAPPTCRLLTLAPGVLPPCDTATGARHPQRRRPLLPRPRQQGVKVPDTRTVCWGWAQRLPRARAMDRPTSLWSPCCTLQIIIASALEPDHPPASLPSHAVSVRMLGVR